MNDDTQAGTTPQSGSRYPLRRLLLRMLLKHGVMHPRFSIRTQRRLLNGVAAYSRLPTKLTQAQWRPLGGRPALVLSPHPPGEVQSVVLYLHGGAYCFGSPMTHAGLAARLASAWDARVCLIDYRLAPEHPYPAALDDAVAAFRQVMEEAGNLPLILAGDSAGGGLALSTALKLRQLRLPMPAALYLLSPWTDLTLSGASMLSYASADPLLNTAVLNAYAEAYAGSTPCSDPMLSPLFADLSGLPPMFIQTGDDEILLSDAERLALRAVVDGVDAELEVYAGLWHVFQAQQIPEAAVALDSARRFIRQRIGAGSAAVRSTADRH